MDGETAPPSSVPANGTGAAVVGLTHYRRGWGLDVAVISLAGWDY